MSAYQKNMLYNNYVTHIFIRQDTKNQIHGFCETPLGHEHSESLNFAYKFFYSGPVSFLSTFTLSITFKTLRKLHKKLGNITEGL